MNKQFFSAIAFFAISASGYADEIKVNQVDYFGPVEVAAAPVFGKESPVAPKNVLDAVKVNPSGAFKTITIDSIAPGSEKGEAVHVVRFSFENRDFTPAEIAISGLKNYRATLDGVRIGGTKVNLNPGTHDVEITYSSQPYSQQPLNITMSTEKDGVIEMVTDGTRMISLNDVLYGTRINNASMSPSGRYILENKSDSRPGGKGQSKQTLYDLKTGYSRNLEGGARWMPVSDKYFIVGEDYEHGRFIEVVDPATGMEEIWAQNIPNGNFQMGPTEDFLVYNLRREGQKEDKDAYQVLEPDDRQPGWRDRSYPAIYKNGALIPLTNGMNNVRLADISDDGQKALVLTSHSRLTKRPTALNSLISIDLPTLEADTLVADDGFIGAAIFSPKGDKVLVAGTPEAFNRIGCILPEDVTPSKTQNELFMVDVVTKEVTPLTREFNPNPQGFQWNRADGKVYFRAENRDMYSLYALDPLNGKIEQIDFPENIIQGFSLSLTAPKMAVWGQSDSNPDRLYSYDIKTKKSTVLDEPSATRLADVRLAECNDWNFTNSNGDTIYGRFYLPDNFDPTKKYPLIVNYYGGCSPTQRAFETRYPWHLYAAMEYVVYVIQPSGATGFGQEFSSRHVSTAGKGVAEDIIEGTQKFCKEHPYVDASKIGCIGASYGGFMTMYLQTVTDLFAAAISHAGISDHTSYWGEGYWGYSYSQVSMGDNYPWTNTELYVNQSPLYNAHKVNTPILFLHGDSDHNVPPGESIQMFTALKLLGKETAMVEISNQDHHILDPVKRQKWQNTIFAWFAKYLKDDSQWWDNLYPAKDY